MATLVFLHAHPDDEASSTSGSMALAHERGDRVVWVCATDGDQGTRPEELADDQRVHQLRFAEAGASAQVLGVDRLEWLGYADSGMHGWESNQNPEAFMNADVDQAAAKLVQILDQEDADVLVGYDWHGNYGHPDHIMVHRVAARAAELAARRPRFLQVTMNRDEQRRMFAAAREAGLDVDFDPDSSGDDGNPVGTPEGEIHWKLDVSTMLERKRAALGCHGSQSDVQMLLSFPPEAFAVAFGHEYYIEDGLDQPMTQGWPFGPEAQA